MGRTLGVVTASVDQAEVLHVGPLLASPGADGQSGEAFSPRTAASTPARTAPPTTPAKAHRGAESRSLQHYGTASLAACTTRDIGSGRPEVGLPTLAALATA